MTILDNFSPFGLGTNRFPVSGPNDTAGIDRSVELMASALKAGVSYIDVAYNYSKGVAGTICKRAFQETGIRPAVTIKSNFCDDQTADSVSIRIEQEFERMGIDHAFCFVSWNVSSYAQFLEIMERGSAYEGAQRAKDQGLIDHICFSTHAPPDDIIKILDSKMFEAVTISLSALNSFGMRKVLHSAEKNDTAVIVMNPVGGGLIPQNRNYFKFLCGQDDETTVQAALRYVYAHPAVKVILSGVSSLSELQENLDAFRKPSLESPEERIARVDAGLQAVSGFCTGCRYCDGCPQNIPIHILMQAYNATLFPHAKSRFGCTDPQILENAEICSRLCNTFGYLPPSWSNPCVGCGLCESKCTAHLPIKKRLEELYHRFEVCGYSEKAMLERLREIIGEKRKIALYPSGGYSLKILSLLKTAFPDQEFDISIFDTSPALWGKSTGGHQIMPPDDILEMMPDMIVVSNFTHSEAIYASLMERLGGAVPVVKLHKQQDVPWIY